MGYRFVILDLDGTALDPQKQITRGVADAVGRVREAGLTVIVCTGRMVQSAMKYWRELGLETPIIGYNGAMVKDTTSGRVLLHRPLDLATTLEVTQFGQHEGLNFQAYENDEMFVERETEGVLEYARVYGVGYRRVASFSEALREGTTKLLAVCEPGRMGRSAERLRDRFGARVMLTQTEGRHVEVCHPHVSKAAASEFVVTRLGGRREETVAVGDGLNDVEMLQWAGLGAAMGNACERVKRAADVVIGSNGEDGLAAFLVELAEGGKVCTEGEFPGSCFWFWAMERRPL